MQQVAKSDMSTGNKHCASYVCKSNDIVFVFTAPYGTACDAADSDVPHPGYDKAVAHKFISDHGLAVRAVGIQVGDAAEAFTVSVANGAVPLLAPQTLTDKVTGEVCVMSEVKMFDDAVLRYISGNYSGKAFPAASAFTDPHTHSYLYCSFGRCVSPQVRVRARPRHLLRSPLHRPLRE